MRLRLSRYVHLLPVGADRVLVLHAISQLRLTIDKQLADLLAVFAEPREVEDGQFAGLVERGVLTDKTPDEEAAAIAGELAAHHGRDPADMVERLRRQAKEGGHSYWATGPALKVGDLNGGRRKLEVLLFGDCDVQMEADFLRKAAGERGLDLRVAATFPDDLRLAAEHPHEAIIIGALRARHTVTDPVPEGGLPYGLFLAQAQAILEGLRAHTDAPILIDNLPEPTVQPLGMADRSGYSHRNRFRLANVALSQLAEGFADTHVVDVAAVLANTGAARLLDDGQTGFTHFGSPGWMLQRPESEKAAVHGQFPDPAPLIAALEGDPYLREPLVAGAHLDALTTVLGIDRKKCVILDLDNTLWPGVLAETGAPFAWSPEVSGPFSYIGLYFGLHEALKALKDRGIVLACVSKNDEATVRELWRYPDHYPRQRLLEPDDFVTWRVNWEDKASNIRSIADELGFDLGAFLFIDDNPSERERVRQMLPEVEVWGEELFSLRRRLLDDPRLMTPRLTAESATRTETTKAQLGRQRHRADAPDEASFIASLEVKTTMARLGPEDAMDRVEELFARTTQFNTTGAKFPVSALRALAGAPGAGVFTLRVSDRFGDHGLTGAAVVKDGEILGLAISCRVLGLGVEHAFLQYILREMIADHGALSGQIIPTARNGPVRNLYRDNAFEQDADGMWRRRLA
ncbi:MAG TPA: HAD-IIIC family phosphatase [Caulobacteraceae bacterium]|nr:HAD-IIIC family phosphatase [Caulobacteraceae bacterium]